MNVKKKLLDALRHALQTGEVSATDVEDVLAEDQGPPPTSAPPPSDRLADLRRAIDDGLLDAGEARTAIDEAEAVDHVDQLPHTDDPRLAALQRAIVEGLDPDDAREAIIDAEVEMSGRENAALEELYADELEKLDRYHDWIDRGLETGEMITFKVPVVQVLPAAGDQPRRCVLVPDASRTLIARVARERPKAAA